jgi:hypothetical protein
MILGKVFNHKKFPSYFGLFYFQFFKLEITKNLVLTISFGFVNLRDIGDLQPPQLVGGRKAFCSLLQVV